MSLTGLAALIGGIVLLFFYYRLHRNHKKDNAFFNFFEIFALFNGFFYILFALPLLFTPDNSFLIGLGYLVGHAFGYIAYGYLIRATWLIARPSLNTSLIFKIYVALGAALTALNAFYFNRPTISEGLIDWQQNQLVGDLIIIYCMIAFVPAALTFIHEAIKQPKNRKRYLLIGFALLLVIISGPVHGIATVETLGSVAAATYALLAADIATIIAYLMLFWGVLSNPKSVTVSTSSK